MIDFANFSSVLTWVLGHGYVLVFLVMCAEGPITTAAAGFAAALGYFNPGVILILSILGDLVPDTIYYLMGRKGRLASIEKMMHRIGLTQERVARLETLLKKHFNKTLIVVKVTPVVGPLGYMLIGYLRLSFRQFILICSAVTIPKAIIFLVVGYYFGQLYNINQYVRDASLLIPLVVIISVSVYLAYNFVARIIAEKFGKI
jgi:membrane protein DedA with SNARE-associated domain